MRPPALVTGGTGGIGQWIALGLMQGGRDVVIVGRDAARGAAALDWLRSRAKAGSVSLMIADLSLIAEVRALAQAVNRAHPALGVLVNNAGIFRARRTETAEGHEAVLAVNHLAPFLLMRALSGALQAGARQAGEPSRIVTVGSSVSDRARVDPDNLELRRGWGMVRAYGQSKLAVMQATFEVARRLDGTGVVAHVVHPGAVATGLVRTPGVIGLAWRVMARWQRTAAEGADEAVQVALSPAWGSCTGAYVKDGRAVTPNRRARDAALVGRVWDATERLIGPG